jgi:hypothetical protein
MNRLTEKEVDALLTKKYHFDAIGVAIAQHTQERTPMSEIFLDIFFDKDGNLQEYIVVRWLNGALEVRNAAMNSLNCDLRELTKLIDGGYYAECDDYERLKEGAVDLRKGGI